MDVHNIFFDCIKINLILGDDRWGHPILYVNTKNFFPDRFGENSHLNLEKYFEFYQTLVEKTC